jgi:hypothetical protein
MWGEVIRETTAHGGCGAKEDEEVLVKPKIL